jgi:hypothetical protein
MNNRTNTPSTHDSPDEESNASTGHKVRLYGEEVANLMNRKPDGRQGAKPKDKEGGIVRRRGPGVFGECVWDSIAVLLLGVNMETLEGLGLHDTEYLPN